jgi:rubrerythrin
MQSAQEFMNAFLREQAELLRGIRRQNRDLYEKFFTKDLLALISDWHEVRDKNPQSFALAEVTDNSARVTTTELISGRQSRHRYHLRKSSENWEIYKKEGECPLCGGSGNRNGQSCRSCGGIGWNDFYRVRK